MYINIFRNFLNRLRRGTSKIQNGKLYKANHSYISDRREQSHSNSSTNLTELH